MLAAFGDRQCPGSELFSGLAMLVTRMAESVLPAANCTKGLSSTLKKLRELSFVPVSKLEYTVNF